MAKKVLYDWGDGKGKKHSISKAEHAQNVEARGYGINLNSDVSAPLTTRGAYGLAQQAADLQYGPQIQANKTLQRSVPTWFANYQATVAANQAAQQAYANPLLQQAQAGITNAGQTAPGLDPGSAQYATDQQAAKGRQSLAQLGYDTLAAVPAASNAYMGGQATVAARELPQVQAGLVRDEGTLRAQRGQAVATAYGDIRQNEQNAQIAYGTLGLNTQKAADDAAAADQAAKDRKAARAVSRKNTRDRIAAQNQRATDAADKAAAKEQEKADKEAAKKKANIQKATGKARVDVDNAINAWNSYVGQETDDTSKPKDPVTGEYPPRKVTPADIRRILQGKGYDAGMIHVALLVRAKKPLDQAAIDYLHSKDPNIRIPREWLGKSSKTPAQDANPHATGEPNEKAPGSYGGKI